MADSPESLFKQAETAAPRDDRLMPTERTYPKTSKTVDVMEALSLMKQRKRNKNLIIKGGLDDESNAVRIAPRPQEHSDDNTDSPEASSIPMIRDEENPTMEELERLMAAMNGQADSGTAAEQNTVPPVTTPKKTRRPRKQAQDNAEVTCALTSMKADMSSIAKAVHEALKNDSYNNESSDVSGYNALAEFKKGSHKVSFMINGMEITVRCLNMTIDEHSHCLVLAFDDEGESFFTPPMQSELTIRYDNVEKRGKLYYFGMDFSLKQLGLRFLGFLYDEGADTAVS